MVSDIRPALQEYVNNYQNTEDGNDSIYELFTLKNEEFAFLRSHRDHIEKNHLGYGDRAFHYMWYLLITHINDSGLPPTVLEIGVFKGQVISLWALIAKQVNTDIKITGITPLAGKMLPNKFKTFFLKLFSRQFKEDFDSGNFYEENAFLNIIKTLFNDFELDYSKLNLIKGYSTDDDVINAVKDQRFSIIYIDGDHSYNTVLHDINTYSGLVNVGGFLVMDDAAFDLPGTKFWKGYKSVSTACMIIEGLGFKNIFNIGHNRVYQKL